MKNRKALPMKAIIPAAMAILTLALLASCDDQPDSEWAGPERLVFLGMMRGADPGQVYLRDERGITQLTDLSGAEAVSPLDPPNFAVFARTAGGVDIHFLNAETGQQETVKRLAGLVYPEPSPDGKWMIREESSILVVSALAGDAPSRILGRTPGFMMGWNCAGDAVYFHDTGKNLVIKLDIESGRRTDLTPPDLAGRGLYQFSLSCDEQVLAVRVRPGILQIYRGRELAKEIEAPEIVWHSVSRDGSRIVYVDPYDDDTTKVMSYEVETGKITELIGPIAAVWAVYMLD